MDDQQKIALIEKIQFSDIDWMDSYRQTFGFGDGVGLPSGLTGSEARDSLIRAVLKDKPIVIKERG